MTLQYIRKVSLTLTNDAGAIADLSALRFIFRVIRGDIQTPNTADIRVYNVSEQTTNIVQKEFTTLTLQAGYNGSFGVIFNGTIMQARAGRENPTDTYLDFTAGDGDGAYNFAIVNESLAAGSTPAQQANVVCTSMNPYGVTAGQVSGLNTQSLPRGKVMFGNARNSMRQIADNSQTSWSIQSGKVNTVPLNSFIPNSTVVVNSLTGMIGLPEQTLNGIKVRTLLNPNIKIGGSIQINNRDIITARFPIDINSAALVAELQQTIHLNNDGLYKVIWVDYVGDTRGQDFYSDITCVSIDAVLGAAQLAKSTALAPPGPKVPVLPYGPANNFGGQN